MSWVSTAEIGRGKRRGKLDDTFTREYYRHFEVRFTSQLDDLTEALTAPGLPSPSDSYLTATGFDNDALCKHLLATEVGYGVYNIEAFYTSDAADPTKQALNPTDESPEITYQTERVEVALQQDLRESPIVNSAGDPYEAITTDDAMTVVTIAQNLNDYQLSDSEPYIFHYNSTSLFGKAPGLVLCTRFEGKNGFRNQTDFWTRTLQFKIMGPLMQQITGGSWANLVLVDQGIRQVVPGTALQTIPPQQLIVDTTSGGAAHIVGSGTVQTVFFDVLAGDFTLTYAGQTTGSLPFSSSAASVQNALNALSTIGTATTGVTVTSTPNSYVVAFQGAFTTQRQRIFTVEGTPVSKPVLLDGNGNEQKSIPPVLSTNTFIVRESVDFGPLNLPIDI